MNLVNVFATVRDRMGSSTVFGEPISRDGVTIIPVARVSAGAGGGAGSAAGPPEGPSVAGLTPAERALIEPTEAAPTQAALPDAGAKPANQESSGEGAGFGVHSSPFGVFVIKDGNVDWRPALDLNKVILGGQIVAIVALLTIRSIIRTAKRRS